MHATSGTEDKARVGDAFPTVELAATSGQLVTVPDPGPKHEAELPYPLIADPEGVLYRRLGVERGPS